MHREPVDEGTDFDYGATYLPESTASMPIVPGARPAGDRAPAKTAAPVALPPGIALLVVHHGPNAGARFLLDLDVLTCGRHPDSDIFLDDVTVSRQHAEFRRTGNTYSIVDLHSLNGTYVGGERVAEAVLRTGDEVQVGKFRMSFRVG
jgi:pSer/pThr/pTyr-binding forkhead associated (FHA) protein